MKVNFWACFYMILLLAGMLRAEDSEDVNQEDLKPKCDPDLPTLSVSAENLITSLEEWNTFLKTHPFFVLGVGDSACKVCC